MNAIRCLLILVLVVGPLGIAHADVFRWDNGALIPGTETVVPGPAAQLDNLSLRFGEFSNLDLTGATFVSADLTRARFRQATLTSTDFTGATVTGANLSGAVSRGFLPSQLYATASYQTKSLGAIRLGGNDLTGWDFHDQYLAGAIFTGAIVDGADFSNAQLTGASIYGATGHGAIFDNANLTDGNLWNMDYSNASFRNANLTNARISNGDVTAADFTGANISGADLSSSKFTKEQLYSTASYAIKDLRDVKLINADMTDANFSDQNLRGVYFGFAPLTGASFAGADVRSTKFLGATTLTATQLYSTKSYQEGDLTEINLTEIDLSGWNLSQQNLSNASFHGSNLSGVDFSESSIAAASFYETNFTNEQLYSTATYQSGNLQQINFTKVNLQDADLSGKNLSHTVFDAAKLARADLSNANIEYAVLSQTTQFGLVRDQIYSTATYQAGHLRGVGLFQNDLRDWDFHGLDLTDASFFSASLANANFTGAKVNGASFYATVLGGFTQNMLQSTSSYENHDLRGVDLGNNNLAGWSFRDQDLTGAKLQYSTLAGTDFGNATIAMAAFRAVVSRGFTKEQLYSTASYAKQDLRGIAIDDNDLDGWNFTDQYIVDADLSYSTVVGTNFSRADARGVFDRAKLGMFLFTGSVTDNMIFPDGSIRSLHLATGETLRVRDYDLRISFPSQITVYGEAVVETGAALRLEFEADDWNSTIAFQSDIPVALGGALELTFAPGVDVFSQIGRTLRIFDWTGVNPTGEFSVASQYPWDLSDLYTSGEVTLLLPGDTNGDQSVDLNDLNNVRNNFGGSGLGDTNADGKIDLVDVNNVRNYFGVSAPQAVPSAAWRWLLSL